MKLISKYQKKLILSRSWIVIVLVLSLLTTSCNKFLDIQPEGELIGDQLLKDAEGFETAMYGLYATMNKNNLYGRNLSHTIPEVLAQYFYSPGNQLAEALLKYDYKHALAEESLSLIWSDMYNNIANVNNVLKSLEKFGPQDLKHYNLYKGEALGLRAFMHFDLLRIYAENIKLNAAATGIPYSTEFGLKAPDFSSLSEVYEKVIGDLTQAEQLLANDQQYITFPKSTNNDNFLKDREIHFNLYAVQATLARVYLTKGDLPNALLYAEKVINVKKHQLLTPVETADGVMRGMLYPKEAIFGLYSKNYYSTVYERFFIRTTLFSYERRLGLKDKYTAFTGTGHDYRLDSYFKSPNNPARPLDTILRFVKLIDQFQMDNQEYLRPAGRIKGINLIRLPEMYFIAAEALLATDPEKARSYFDTVIKSRGLVGLKDRIPAVSLTLDLITAERYKEFLGEGQTFFNMKRLNSNIVDIQQQVVPASKAIYVLPIPLNEYDYRN